MARRLRVSRGRDRKIFRRTASVTKRINIAPRVMRGGIRL